MKQNPFQMPIKVWYKVLPGKGNVIWPILDVRYSFGKISIPQPLLSLVDSGASDSILHPLVAEALGFNLKKLGVLKSGGLSVSGKYNWWILPELIDVNIYGYKFRRKFIVIDNPNMIWPCILGEDSIFEYARIDFQKFKGYFELRFRKDIN